MNFKPCCLATAIGSFPHIDPASACQILLDNLPQIPVWPQLPKKSFLENMNAQYSEAMPRVIIDRDKEKIFFETSGDILPDLEKFYEKYLTDDVDYFSIGVDYASGFYTMLELLKKQMNGQVQYLKGQVTGPISFGLSVTDENKKVILYNENLFDTVIKGLAMKVKWQEKKMNESFPGVKTIMFFDEPYLTSYGSAYISLSREQVIDYLNEVFSVVKGLTGVHCCGKTDWSILMETNVDIINFDAYEYFESVSLYPEELKKFLERGGVLSWGIIPTSDKIHEEDSDSLVEKLEGQIDKLVSQGMNKERLLEKCLITPSCGTGTMSIEDSEKVIRLTKEVSQKMREKYFKG